MDTLSRTILGVLGDAGYAVAVTADQFQSIDHDTGERYLIRYGDLYAAAVRPAERCGIELGDQLASDWVVSTTVRHGLATQTIAVREYNVSLYNISRDVVIPLRGAVDTID